ERREDRPPGARLVESPPPLRRRRRPRLALRVESAPRRPPADRRHPHRPHRGVDAGDPRGTRRRLRVILYRCFAWDRRAAAADAGGATWVPRAFQGDGRHDNADRYGCLYLAEGALSAVAEQLAR